ncbi:MAG: ABC transporter substrate-binding protein, partial [Myxococcaceae bacterium]
MKKVCALMLCLAGLSCGPKPEPGKADIKLGSIFSVTGSLAAIGAEQLEAAQLAVSQINAAGGVQGAQLKLTNRDDGTAVDKAKTAAEAFVADGVPVVFGAIGSAISMGVSEVTSAADMVQISASSTSPLLTTAADNGHLFRTCTSDALQGKLLAKRAKARGLTKVAVIHIPGAY